VTQISERTVRLTGEYIDRANPPAALRRLLTEGQDSVRRALRCQQVDRQAG
jgi:aminopeptidase N